jgi:tRNA(adenine34) deaminase
MQKKVDDFFKIVEPPDAERRTKGKLLRELAVDEHWMGLALQHAEEAGRLGEVPVGAVVVGKNGFLAAAGNSPIGLADPSAHAEMLAIRAAAKLLGNYRLPETTLYVTLEPCIMCMGALIQARISRLVYGAADPKTGAAISVYAIGTDQRLNHTVAVTGGVLAEACAQLLKDFFKKRRGNSLMLNSPFLKTP